MTGSCQTGLLRQGQYMVDHSALEKQVSLSPIASHKDWGVVLIPIRWKLYGEVDDSFYRWTRRTSVWGVAWITQWLSMLFNKVSDIDVLYMYTLHQLSLMNPLDGEWHVCTQARAVRLGHYMYRPALSFALLWIHFQNIFSFLFTCV